MMAERLLELADDEIKRLTEDLRELRAELENSQKNVTALAEENAQLHGRLLTLLPTPTELPLTGVRIGLIGHPSREMDYRAIIERLGGELVFAGARDKLGLIDRVVQKAHGTLYLTAWGSHTASQRATAAARRYQRPLQLSNQPGLAMVERIVLEQLLPVIRGQ